MIPQMRASPFQPHGDRIRVGGADFEVGCAKVVAMHLPLLPTFLGDPIMPRGIVLSQFLSLCLGEDDRECNRHRAGHHLW